MTNTSDFRKYSFATDTNYLIKEFNYSRPVSNRAEAPKLAPEVNTGLKIRGNSNKKSRIVLKREQKASTRQAIMTIAVALICAFLIGAVVNSFVIKNELTKDIASMQVDIANAQSEHISLQSQLDSMVSISMIDEYAVSKLGMTKMKSNQIQYMDVSEYKAQRAETIKQAKLPEATKQLTNLAGNK